MAALGIFWFYLALSVESSFIPIRDVINEHRLYLPSAGFFMALVALAALAVRERRAAAGKAWVVMALVCLLLGGMTIARNRVWSDALLLWQDNAAKAPNNPLVLGNLANEYMQRRMPERALPLFVRAIEIMPHLLFRTQLGLGDALKEMGMFGQRFSTGHELVLSGGTMGIGQVDIRRMPEWVATINNNMGLAYEYLGEPAKAMRAYDFAVSADPSYALAWLNMGLLAVQLNDATHLEKAFMRLRTLEPQLADILASQITR
jgi:tetratricopeptide (TPR) repeat protein